MVFKIYQKRYGKFLIAFAAFALIYTLFSTLSVVKSWRIDYDYNHSEKFKKEFDPGSYGYSENEDGTDRRYEYENAEDYAEGQAYVYDSEYDFTKTAAERAKEQYQVNYTYHTQNSNGMLIAWLLGLTALIGFLAFFVDQKTAFNRYLFSLPVSRQELFAKKFLFVGGITLGVITLAKSLQALIMYLGIPQPYFNVSMGPYLLSIVNTVILHGLLFTACAFIASMVGNLVFGSITGFIFLIFSCFMPAAFEGLTNSLHVANLWHYGDFNMTNLFILEPGKTGGYWYIGLLFLGLSALIYLWGQKEYQTLSLEYDGDYLLHRQARLPIWLLMTVYTSFVFVCFYMRPFDSYFEAKYLQNPYADPSLLNAWKRFLFVIVIDALVCFVVVYFSAIKRRFREHRDLKMKKQLT